MCCLNQTNKRVVFNSSAFRYIFAASTPQESVSESTQCVDNAYRLTLQNMIELGGPYQP